VTLVVGTAGHIDHGKTSLLRALTGIDADRLPEEQRRGMTIDVGYAHLALPDGTEVDFVDVPGHDRLIGNMLVGAGEIDAALLVVAADDGPRAQTLEHLGLLDALGIDRGLAVVTKTDAVPADRAGEVAADLRALLEGTSLQGVPVIPASSATGAGIAVVRTAIAALVEHAPNVESRPPRLAIDRVFSVRGRGVVVTGTLRGAGVGRGDVLRVEPGAGEVRVREIQVHNHSVDRAGPGRTALNLAGVEAGRLRRGDVLTAGPGVESTERLLVALRHGRGEDMRHGMPVRLHLATEQVDGRLDLGRRASVDGADASPGWRTAILRLERPIAAAFGDRFVLRRPSPGETLAGGRVLDPLPPRGVSRRRMTAARLRALLDAGTGSAEQREALVALHGALLAIRLDAWDAIVGMPPGQGPRGASAGGIVLAPDVQSAVGSAIAAAVPAPLPIADVRAAAAVDLRRRVALDAPAAAAVVEALIAALVRADRLVRDGDLLLPAGSSVGPDPALRAAMDRLEQVLAVSAPPSLRAAAAAAQCPPAGLRVLEMSGRIVRVEDDLAWAASTYRGFEDLALRLAADGALSPAAFRDATGTSRRFALAILEDLDRRAILVRTPSGHVPGPRAPTTPRSA
jgi:selenocysteine-specific elongation factor